MSESIETRRRKLQKALRTSAKRISEPAMRLADALWMEIDAALTHEECLSALPTFVHEELMGAAVAKLHPAVKHHLDRCESCSAQYLDLLEIALADESDVLLSMGPTPQFDLSFLQGPKTLWDYAKQKAAMILAAVAPTLTVNFDQTAQNFYNQVQVNGLEFALEPIRRDQGSSPVDEALTTIAVTYAATKAIVDSFTPEEVDLLAAQNLLCAQVEKRAKIAALEIHVERSLGWKIAEQFAAQVCQDPANLRALVEKYKQ